MKHANNKETKFFDLTPVLACPQKPVSVLVEFEPQNEWLGNNPYSFCGSGQFSGKFTFDEKLTLEGQIKIPTKFVCSKCGAGFEENLFIPVCEELVEGQNEEHFSFLGNRVELLPIIAEIVATDIPSQAFCRPDCLGVCAVCGENLNEKQCDCDKKLRGDSPFASLKDKFN